MNRTFLAVTLSALLIQGCTTITAPLATQANGQPAIARQVEMDPQVLIENNSLGNCLACHSVVKHPDFVAGNLGPPFVAMKERFPDKAALRAIIYDEQVFHPDTIMPPFGRNHVLTVEQINVISDYILNF